MLFHKRKITISGYLKDQESKEVLLYSKVFVLELKKGVLTNEYGFFSIQVPSAQKYTLQLASSGYPVQTVEVDATKAVQQDFFMNAVRNVQEVTVTAKKSNGQELVENTEVSVIRLDIKEAKNLPAIGGETDVLKVAQLLPGINRGSEGGTNFFVRGGDGDQNLILVDEATVYNPRAFVWVFLRIQSRCDQGNDDLQRRLPGVLQRKVVVHYRYPDD